MGDNAPEMVTTDWVKNIPQSKDLKGNFIVVDFWATWCAPCLESVPHMNNLVNKNKSRSNLVFLASFIPCSAKETVFKCTIKGYNKLEKNVFIDNAMSLEFYNALAINERASAHLTKKGTYTLKFNITYPQVVQIQSGNGYYTEALVSPGDTVALLLTYKITDVWATWCSPCIGEFDFYPRLVEDFKNKVVFVMLCVASKEQVHGNMIAKLPFAAHHYLLSDIQYTELKNDFGITGIPHYLFINKKGEVLNNYKRPSDYEALFGDIQKQL